MSSDTESPIRSNYDQLLLSIVTLLEDGRRSAARAVNAILTATYWLIGERLVRHEQSGAERAAYGTELLKRLSRDLGLRLGRGFAERNLEQMRQFYLQWPQPQTLSADSGQTSTLEISQTASAKSVPPPAFPLSWSHYVRLLSVPGPQAKRYYESEALRGGWSVRQLDRQIATLAYERSRGLPGKQPASGELRTPDSEIRDPFVLEFLGLKDEYSEAELEEALIRELEQFLLELATILHSWHARSACAWARSGTASTWCSSTAGCGRWSSSN